MTLSVFLNPQVWKNPLRTYYILCKCVYFKLPKKLFIFSIFISIQKCCYVLRALTSFKKEIAVRLQMKDLISALGS